jgi:hypothetical protein
MGLLDIWQRDDLSNCRFSVTSGTGAGDINDQVSGQANIAEIAIHNNVPISFESEVLDRQGENKLILAFRASWRPAGRPRYLL